MRLPVLLIADDISGAAECAGVFASRKVSILVASEMRDLRDRDDDVLVVNTDSRYVSPDEAAQRCRSVVAHGDPYTTVIKKIDSTLRGPLPAELSALRDTGTPVVVAAALPDAARTVVGGVLRLDGVPLADTDAWAAEATPPPLSVADALAPLRCVDVDLATIRSTPDVLAKRLRDAFAGDAVPVCDAKTDDDLDNIVAAGALLEAPIRWAGSAGLVSALARTISVPAKASPDREPSDAWPSQPPLFVIGTAATAAREQMARLSQVVDEVVELEASLILKGDRTVAADISTRIAGRSAAICVAPGERSSRSPDVVQALAQLAVSTAANHGAFVLSGGETAQAVLTALDIAELKVQSAWGDGTVVSSTPDGRIIVTKPGGFGDPDTLVRIAQRLGVSTPQGKGT